MKINLVILILCLVTGLWSCIKNSPLSLAKDMEDCEEYVWESPEEFGFMLDDYVVKRDTVRYGDSFGAILERHSIEYPKIYEITQVVKDTFDMRRIQVGRPYTVFCSKDSLERALAVIYQSNPMEYVVIHMDDTLKAYKERIPTKIIEREASGIIQSSLYETLQDQGANPELTYYLSEIYAWSVDFFRLYPGDRFKVIYTEKFIHDTTSVGIGNIKAAFFEHQGEGFYAFEYMPDSLNGSKEYFDENAKNLRRAFLKSPLKFSRISSRYNLKRRIAYYGKVKPHKGTDFAAPVGTPIMSTANGTVIESGFTRGNGNYVKIRHNGTYSTQYLHMQKRKVRVGQSVRQGEVIGWVGMTGFTAGPHVCYRFWKNGAQVDPFRQKLPEAEPISDALKEKYLEYIMPLKNALDAIPFEPKENEDDDLLASLSINQ